MKNYPLANKRRATNPQTNKKRGAHDGGGSSSRSKFQKSLYYGFGEGGGDNFELVANVTEVSNFDEISYDLDDQKSASQHQFFKY
jgi:hypothetical protein